jgi:hypothetical protein
MHGMISIKSFEYIFVALMMKNTVFSPEFWA